MQEQDANRASHGPDVPASAVPSGPSSPTPQPKCDGCGIFLFPYEAKQWGVCLSCTKVRHRAVLTGKCSCGKLRRPKACDNGMGRRWFSCLRCLGTIRQIS